MTRSRGCRQDNKCRRRGRARQRDGDAKGGSLAVKTAADSPGGSVAVVGDVTGLVGVALPALVAKRGDNRRNPDLAITIVEALALALGVLALLRRSCCVHCLNSPIRPWVSSGVISGGRLGRNCAAIRVLS